MTPIAAQSGATTRTGKTGKGNRWLRAALGTAAMACAKTTGTFLGERYRRIVKRRGKLKALVAVARSILVVVWNLLSDPTARFHDLGAGLPHPPHRHRPQGFATTSPNSPRSATASPSSPPPDQLTHCYRHKHDPAPLRGAGCCRAPTRPG